MTGETNLSKLLRTLKPELKADEFVFCTLKAEEAKNLDFEPTCFFTEAEGVTIICLKVQALKANIDFIYPCRMITLTVHSSLDAVGLTAAVASKLAASGISANIVAAYYHDHVFVPCDKAEEAMRILSLQS